MPEPSHVIITCTCGTKLLCPVPGHVGVPPDPVDPLKLVAAGQEAQGHLADAVLALMKARASWVSRGLPADNRFPLTLDRLAESITHSNVELRRWTAGAMVVAERRGCTLEEAKVDA